MRKYIITIIFLVFLYNLNSNDINIYAENNNENCDIYTLIQENQESFELFIENPVIDYNDEIHIIINKNAEMGASDGLSINIDSNFSYTISDGEGYYDLYIENKYEQGDHLLNISTTSSTEDTSYTVYVYSDGERCAVTSSSPEDSKELYYTTIIEEESENDNNDGDNNDDNVNNHQGQVNFENFVFDDGSFKCEPVKKEDIVLNKVKISGVINWGTAFDEIVVDELLNPSPLVNNIVYLYENGTTKCAETRTDDDGKFEFVLNPEDILTEGYGDLYIQIFPDNEATYVAGYFTRYRYTSPLINNVAINQSYVCDINIATTDTRSKAYEVSQMMIYPYRYVKEMSGDTLDKIPTLYPNGFGNSFCLGFLLAIQENSYDKWDIGMHEYGHYINYYFDACPIVFGKHNANQDLTDKYGKSYGLKLAYSEALATYIGMSSQYKYQLYNEDIFTIEQYNYPYTFSDGTVTYIDEKNMGEVNEIGIYNFLLMLNEGFKVDTTLIPGITSYDAAKLNDLQNYDYEIGYQNLFDVIYSKKRNNFSELISDLVISFPNKKDDMGYLLEYFGFSPYDIIYFNLLFGEEANHLQLTSGQNLFEWNNYVYNVTNLLDRFDIKFYSDTANQTYTIENITNYYYYLTDADLNELLAFDTYYIRYQIIGYHTNSFTTGPYFSGLYRLELPIIENLNSTSSINEYYQSEMFKFSAPIDGVYEFKTIGNLDTYGELFNKMVANTSSSGLIEQAYGDNSENETNLNFRFTYYLEKNQTVYLRVTLNNDDLIGYYTPVVTCIEHTHNFVYTSISSTHHILKCHCGETSGIASIHCVDSSASQGLNKRCMYCGVLIDSTKPGFFPVIGTNKIKEEDMILEE